MLSSALGNQVIQVGVVVATLETFAVILRLLARWKSKAVFAADDILVVMSLIPSYVMVLVGVLSPFDDDPPWYVDITNT